MSDAVIAPVIDDLHAQVIASFARYGAAQGASYEPDIFSEIDDRNGWVEDSKHAPNNEQVDKRAARLFYEVMMFVTRGLKCDNAKDLKRMSIRFTCVMWVLAPGLLVNKNNKVASLEDIGDAYGHTRCWISMVAENFSQAFGIYSRNQKPLAHREMYAKSAKNGWDTRRDRRKTKIRAGDSPEDNAGEYTKLNVDLRGKKRRKSKSSQN